MRKKKTKLQKEKERALNFYKKFGVKKVKMGKVTYDLPVDTFGEPERDLHSQ